MAKLREWGRADSLQAGTGGLGRLDRGRGGEPLVGR